MPRSPCSRDASASRRKWRARRCFSLATKRASSTARISSSIIASPPSELRELGAERNVYWHMAFADSAESLPSTNRSLSDELGSYRRQLEAVQRQDQATVGQTHRRRPSAGRRTPRAAGRQDSGEIRHRQRRSRKASRLLAEQDLVRRRPAVAGRSPVTAVIAFAVRAC